jgi:type II secretory pathway component PulK
MNRRGFALIAVLWVVTALSSVVGLGLVAVRLNQRAWQNRIVLTRGRWAAEACIAIADKRIRDGRFSDTSTVDLGQSVRCEWTAHDPTSRLNLNTASMVQIGRLLQSIGFHADSAERLARAVRQLRRAGEIEDIRAIALLPGFDRRVLPYVTVDGPGVVNTATASSVVLECLPGMTQEALGLILDRQRSSHPFTSLDGLIEELSPASRDAFAQHYRELAGILSFNTTQLVTRFSGWLAQYGPYPRFEIELFVARSPDGLVVLRRRMR